MELADIFEINMELNKQLEFLYASRWKGICNALQAIIDNRQTVAKPSYPFLLSVTRWENGQPDENWYADADLKVMIFGQETNSGVGDCDDFGIPPSLVFNSSISVAAVMGIYENFYATYYHSDGFGYNCTGYGTFHYGVNRFMSLLNSYFSDKRVAYLWNNIVKIGKAEGAGFCGKEIYDVQKQHFMVIRKEVDILKPDLLLFLTGSYDDFICDCWEGARFGALPSFASDEAAKVSLPELNTPAYRINHPSARLPKEEKDARMEVIVNDVINKK